MQYVFAPMEKIAEKKAGISNEAIISIYFAEINSRLDLFYDFYSNNNAIIKPSI